MDHNQIPEGQSAAIQHARVAMMQFQQVFGRELTVGNLAEVYAAQHLGLELLDGPNHPGYDARDPRSNERYQIKYRGVTTANVEVNNFDFDYLLLVNLDAAYKVSGIWRLTIDQVKANYYNKPNTKLYQASQKAVKSIGERLL